MKIIKVSLISCLVFGLLAICACYLIQWYSYRNQTKIPESSAPRSGRFISYGDESIFIQESGKHQPIGFVFIHGTGSWSQLWKPTMDLLTSKGHFSVSIDLSPFGYSYESSPIEKIYEREEQAKKIVFIINKLDLKKVYLIGHSFGGRPTLTAALMIPERIEHLVLINAALGFGPDSSTPPSPPSALVSSLVRNDLFRNTLTSVGTLPSLTKFLVSNFVADQKSLTWPIITMYKMPLRLKGKNAQISAWLKTFLLSDDNELLANKAKLKSFVSPVALIWGSLDTITPLWQAEEIKNFFPSAKLEVIPGVGHIPIIENKQAFEQKFTKVLGL